MSTNLDPARPAGPDETINLRDTYVAHGRGVPFENGWSWIAAAWSIFRRAAGIWIGMVLTLAVIYTVLAVLPVIGAIASFVVGPVFTAGLVLTSRTIEQGGEVQFAQLFGGFKYRFGTLLVVGVLYLAGTAARTLHPESVGVITINMTTSFIQAGNSTKLYADARVLKDGRSMSFVEGEAKNEDGSLVAKAVATVRVIHKEKQ